MKEIPIIFQPEIVRKILDGICNLTFRVIKPQPHWSWDEAPYIIEASGQWCFHGHDGWGYKRCPFGQAGDKLWLRETFFLGGIKPNEWVSYKADTRESDLSKFVWKPSIFMPRWASRITLERTEPAYVKRTLEITEEEAKLCGFESLKDYHNYWNFLNKKRGFPFEDNVWLWGVPFGAFGVRGK